MPRRLVRMLAVFAFASVSIAISQRADAGPVCTGLDDYKRVCQDGGGLAAACTGLADALAGGRGSEPDHARAAVWYDRACQRIDGDPEACLALAALKKTGWMFEVERDPSA